MSSKIFVISGPSGSGKSTLLSRLVKAAGLRGRLVQSVSLTTRPRRTGEKNGRDYFFTSPQAFQRLLRRGEILERTRYLGYDYGTPRGFVEQILRQGRHLALCLDLKGGRNIRRLYPRNSVLIFVAPPSLKELRQRIAKRCRKTGPREINRRLGLARRELGAAGRYDYCVLNKELAAAARELKKIIRQEIKH
jgi:guanylate kinase